MTERVRLHEVYFEMRRYGKYLRVHAIDPHSGLEAIATGKRSMGEAYLKRNAHMKLEYILTKKKRDAERNRRGWTG